MNPMLTVYAVLILIIIMVMGIALLCTWLADHRRPAPAQKQESEGTTVVIHISWLALRYQLRELRRRIRTARITTAERVIVKSVLGSRLIQVEEAPVVGQDTVEEEEEEELFHQSTTRPLPPPPVAPVAPVAPVVVPTPPAPVPPSLSLKDLAKDNPALFDTLLYGLACRIYLRALQEGGRITRDGFVRNSKQHGPEEQRMRISPSEWNYLMKEPTGIFWQAGLVERVEGEGVCFTFHDMLKVLLDENGTPHASGGVAILEHWVDAHWSQLKRGQDSAHVTS